MNSLEPLEFDECIVDSPAFRSNLSTHEKILHSNSENIKKIIKEIKDLSSASKGISTFNLIRIPPLNSCKYLYSLSLFC